jgi:hypothetical protein
VIKEYDGFELNMLDPEQIEEVLKQYFADTEEAKKKLEENSNPLNQTVEINGGTYALQYKIIPQGALMLEREKRIKKPFTIRDGIPAPERTGKVKILVGQQFIEGLNLSRFRNFDFVRGKQAKEQLIFEDDLKSSLKIYEKLSEKIMEFFSYLNKLFNSNFSFNPVNVKPFCDEKNKKITIVITDLSASLKDYYNASPKFE